jgi:hypothetical protein
MCGGIGTTLVFDLLLMLSALVEGMVSLAGMVASLSSEAVASEEVPKEDSGSDAEDVSNVPLGKLFIAFSRGVETL